MNDFKLARTYISINSSRFYNDGNATQVMIDKVIGGEPIGREAGVRLGESAIKFFFDDLVNLKVDACVSVVLNNMTVPIPLTDFDTQVNSIAKVLERDPVEVESCMLMCSLELQRASRGMIDALLSGASWRIGVYNVLLSILPMYAELFREIIYMSSITE